MDQHAVPSPPGADMPPLWPEPPFPVAGPVRTHGAVRPPRHVHLIGNLGLGGAQRIVADLAASWSARGTEADIVVWQDRPPEHRIDAPGVALHRVGRLPKAERRAFAAGMILATRLPAYAHLISPAELAPLWEMGCRIVPVIHNAPGGWTADPLLFDGPGVPFIVACGEAVARALLAHGVRKPVRVLRHVIAAPPDMAPSVHQRVRDALGVTSGQRLVGMVGRFAPQKNHGLAIAALAEMRRRGRDVRLAIIGGTEDAAGATCRRAADAVARRLLVRDHVVMPGPVAQAGSVIAAFDVFLNTSRFEGVSIATMEAVACGVPVVSADVGGQSEALGERDRLMPAEADAAAWADAIDAALDGGRACGAARRDTRARDAAAALWPWMLAVGPGARPGARRADLLFVTGNLDVGGAQRSLCNLAAALAPRGLAITVAVAGTLGVPGFMAAALREGVTFVDLSARVAPGGGLADRASRVLALAREMAPATLAFWNMDAATKMIVVKAMAGGPVRLAEISPGPMLYRELDREGDFGRALGMAPDRYLASLDLLVAKYDGGLPALERGQPRRLAIIPNGVPSGSGLLPRGEGPSPPEGADPALAVVSVGRLVAAKRPELLPLVARALARHLPGATLTVVGGRHDAGETLDALLGLGGGALPGNLLFAGPDHRVAGFLGRFACLYMVSRDQGCPNASLEAMAAGLPVVANPDGGTEEQVVHGVTGLLVPDPGTAAAYADALARALASVLRDPAAAQAMGAAGRQRARTRFSMAAMADAYARALDAA